MQILAVCHGACDPLFGDYNLKKTSDKITDVADESESKETESEKKTT
jgi:hypothetical protein